MSLKFFKHRQTVTATVALLTGLLSTSFVWAHGGGSHGADTRKTPSTQSHKKSSKSSRGYRSPDDLNLNPRELQPLHGGQVTATKWHFFEVVYTPRETRIYVYSPSRRAMGAGGLRGEAVMQVNGNPKQFRYRVKQATDKQGRVYGSVVVDLTRVRDGDMQVAFDLQRLPFEQEPKARFTQTFSLTRPPISVTVARLTEADQPLIERQRVCPVMDQPLGEHGKPLKVVIDGRPIFVCCQGCIDKVVRNSDFYFRKAADTTALRRAEPSRTEQHPLHR